MYIEMERERERERETTYAILTYLDMWCDWVKPGCGVVFWA